MGKLSYTSQQSNLIKQKYTIKSENEKALMAGGEFPNCKGLYPDCSEKPSLLDNKCRNCPKTEDIKKPKLEWVDCEHCGEDAVPVDVDSKKDQNEDTKCHVCGKINSAKHISEMRGKGNNV